MSLIEISQPVGGLVSKAIKNLLDLTEEDDWFGEASNLLTFSDQVIKGFEHVRALSFYTLHKNWDKLDIELKKRYGFGFWEYALNAIDREQSTIQSWIRTAELWLVNKPDQQVTILERVNGKPVIENGVYQVKEVQFDPLQIPLTKLMRCNTRRESMDATLWEMLVDDYYTCNDIMSYTSKNGQAPEYRFILEGPGIYKEADLALHHICDLNFEEYESDEHVKHGIKILFQCLGIQTDEELIAKILHKTYRRGINAFNGDQPRSLE